MLFFSSNYIFSDIQKTKFLGHPEQKVREKSRMFKYGLPGYIFVVKGGE